MNFRTIIEPFRIKSVESVKFTRREDREAALARGRLQRLPPARRGRPDRPADGFGDRRHVRRAVERGHAGRRVLRRQPLVLPLRGGRQGPDRVRARHPHAPGPGCRADPLSHGAEAGPDRSQQQSLRHDARQHRGGGRRGPGPRHPRGHRAAGHSPVQGQRRPRRARAPARGAREPGAAGDGDGHQQLGRRPACVAREPARRPQVLRPVRQAVLPRRVPVRRELLVHQAPRARAGRIARRRPSPRRCSRWPTGARCRPRRTGCRTSAASWR